MKEPDQETIEVFAKRKDRTVMRIAMAFAIGGALMDIGAHTISAIFMKGGGVSMIWGMWIPRCYRNRRRRGQLTLETINL